MSELPEGWAIVPLGDISEVKGGKRLPKGAKFADEVTNHPYIRVSDFRGRTVSLDNIQYLSEDVYQHVSNYTINSKDIYISIAGTIGVIGTIPEGLDGANLTENAAKITNINFLEQRFLLYFLNSGAAQAHFHEQTVSTSQPKLALFRIKTLEIPLAPLAEQKRIADKLDALLARVDGCRALLTRVPAILKRFRQAVLAAATSGALTADWREGQNELRRQNRYLVADSNCEVTNFEDRYKSVRLGTLVQEPMRNGKSVRDGNGHLVLRL